MEHPLQRCPSMTSSLFGSRRSREPRVHVVRPGFRAVGFWISCGAERALDVLCDFYRNFYRTPAHATARQCTLSHGRVREPPTQGHCGTCECTLLHGVSSAHNPKFRGSAAGPRRVGENPPLQRVGRIVGKAAEPVSKVHSDLGVRSWFGSAHLHSGGESNGPICGRDLPRRPVSRRSQLCSS